MQRVPARASGRLGRETVELQIPKLRRGSYFPSFLEPRRRSEQALLAVVQQAYVCGVSTRRVDQLVESLGLRISKSEVSRVCAALDEHVEAFRTRPLEGAYPYLFLDAKVEKVRDGGRVVNKALVIAHGVHETGRREILSIDVGEAETEAFWTEFLRGLVTRGLVGVQLAISDAHAGLKAAIAKVLGCSWQRCTVHFLQRLPRPRAPRSARAAGGADPPDLQRRLTSASARPALGSGRASRRPAGQVATMLEDAETDILAFYAFPRAHWRKLRSTNPLERFNKEIGRRTDVVGIFPDDHSLIRLAGMLCIEQNDEWLVGRAYLSAESISLVLAGPDDHTDKEKKEEVRELQAA